MPAQEQKGILSSLKKWQAIMGFVLTLGAFLAFVPSARDWTTQNIVGAALAGESKNNKETIDTLANTLQEMVKFNNFMMQLMLPESLRDQGYTDEQIDTMMKMYKMQLDTIFKSDSLTNPSRPDSG